jgi:hypothetical protein
MGVTYDSVAILLAVAAGVQIAVLIVFFTMAVNISAIRKSVERISRLTPDSWRGCAVEACPRNGIIQAKDGKWYCRTHYYELFE